MTIRTAIVGYGNLGRSAEKMLTHQTDMELVGVFSRRPNISASVPVWPVAATPELADTIDVLLVCVGSAT